MYPTNNTCESFSASHSIIISWIQINFAMLKMYPTLYPIFCESLSTSHFIIISWVQINVENVSWYVSKSVSHFQQTPIMNSLL